MDPTNFVKDRIVLKRKLEEAAYAEALREFQSGEYRTGIMAKALAECGGDQDKAKAAYIQMAAKAILDDVYIAQRAAAPKGDGPAFIFGGLSLLVPGLGQLLQGRLWPAVGFLLLALYLWLFLLGWAIHIWAMINAAGFERARHNPGPSNTQQLQTKDSSEEKSS